MTPTTLIGLAIFVFALSKVPGGFKSGGPSRLKWWQALAGLLAVAAAILIVLNPEFLALGILGDSVFFDLLVLCLSLQIQSLGARVWSWVATGFSRIIRVTSMRNGWLFWAVTSFFYATVAAIQKAVHRISS